MSDCANAEIRDRLPDLLHEQLDARTRAAVLLHVEQCGDCRAELALLREALIALSSGMRSVDVASIASVVVARTAAPTVPAPRRHRRVNWRIAASIVILAVGGASFAVIRSTRHQSAPPGASALAVAPATPVVDTARSVAARSLPQPSAAPLAATQGAELSAAGGVSDLSDGDLRALLNDLDSIDAVPPTDPEPVNVRVALPGRGSSE